MSDNTELNGPEACTQRCYIIGPEDLPLSCPSREQRVWDAHPRVYLSIEEGSHVFCPYCGAKYILEKSSS